TARSVAHDRGVEVVDELFGVADLQLAYGPDPREHDGLLGRVQLREGCGVLLLEALEQGRAEIADLARELERLAEQHAEAMPGRPAGHRRERRRKVAGLRRRRDQRGGIEGRLEQGQLALDALE